MHIRGFHHLAIQVHDLEKQAAFYRDVLGLAETARHRREDGALRSIWMEIPGGGFLALEAVTAMPTPSTFRRQDPGLLLFALRIPREERSSAVKRLTQHRVQIDHETRWTVYFRDLEGNRLALSHHPEDPVGEP